MSVAISKQTLLAHLHQLPSLPAILQEVIASFCNPNLDAATLSHKIEQDQGLSARVLRVANSSFYGLPRKVGSVQDALVVLGFDTIRSMVLSAGMVQAFPAVSGSTFDRQRYWQRSFRVALITKALASQLRKGMQLAFTAGMFHDIGLLVFDLCIPEKFAELLQHADSALNLVETERAVLGFDHAEIGAELIRLWNFPSEIEQAVRCWQQPDATPEPLAGIVHIAVLLERGLRGDALMEKLPEHCRTAISWARIEACLPSQEQLEGAAGLVLAG